MSRDWLDFDSVGRRRVARDRGRRTWSTRAWEAEG